VFLGASDSKRAVQVYTRVLAIHAKYFGETSVAYANSLTNLASAYVIGDGVEDPDDRARSLQLYRRALQIKLESALPNHLSIAQTAYNLTVLLAKEGNFADAYVSGQVSFS
jgi:hypothetical protein